MFQIQTSFNLNQIFSCEEHAKREQAVYSHAAYQHLFPFNSGPYGFPHPRCIAPKSGTVAFPFAVNAWQDARKLHRGCWKQVEFKLQRVQMQPTQKHHVSPLRQQSRCRKLLSVPGWPWMYLCRPAACAACSCNKNAKITGLKTRRQCGPKESRREQIEREWKRKYDDDWWWIMILINDEWSWWRTTSDYQMPLSHNVGSWKKLLLVIAEYVFATWWLISPCTEKTHVHMMVI